MLGWTWGVLSLQERDLFRDRLALLWLRYKHFPDQDPMATAHSQYGHPWRGGGVGRPRVTVNAYPHMPVLLTPLRSSCYGKNNYMQTTACSWELPGRQPRTLHCRCHQMVHDEIAAPGTALPSSEWGCRDWAASLGGWMEGRSLRHLRSDGRL